MPKQFHLQISPEDRHQLERWSKQPPKTYLRDRARAILAASEGVPVYQIPSLLHIRVHRTTVSIWCVRFIKEGPKGLVIRLGRGRKPGFFPSGERGRQARA